MAEKRKKKWVKWVIIGSVLLVIGLFSFYVYSSVQKANELLKNALPSVEVVKDDIKVVVQAGGVVDSVDVTDVYAAFDAKVDGVPVKDGDEVKKGDVLLALKNEKLDDEIDTLNATLSDTDAKLQAAGAAKTSSVTSPVAGRVKQILVEKDQSVTAAMENSGALFIISADDTMELRIPATDAMKAGEAVKVTVGDKTVDSTISKIASGEAVILIADDSYPVDASAAVTDAADAALGTGTLAIHAPYYVTAKQGVVSEISVKVDEKISSGARLLKLEDAVYPDSYYDLLQTRQETLQKIDDKEAQRNSMQIIAPADGYVTGLTATVGMPITEDALICSIKSTGAYKIKLAVDELDIATVQIGQSATVVLDALPTRSFTGTVSKISGVGNSMNGVTTYDVTILLNETENIRAGMSARADIVTASKSGVLVIPADTIKTIDGEKYVMLVPAPSAKDAFTAEPVETKITIGLYNGSEAEIISGLTEGQYVQDLNAETGLESLMRMRTAGMGG